MRPIGLKLTTSACALMMSAAAIQAEPNPIRNAYFGEMYSTIVEDAPGHDNPDLVTLRSLDSLEQKQQWFFKYVLSVNRGAAKPKHPDFFAGPSTVKSAWQIMMETAEQHNEPGVFTAMVGFEWSGAPGGANLHRNVLFRDANQRARRANQLPGCKHRRRAVGLDAGAGGRGPSSVGDLA